MAALGFVTIHGMGETPIDYADDFVDEVKKKMGTKHAEKVECGSIFYQDILQENEERYYKAVKRSVSWSKLRKFVLYGFADAASLETQKTGNTSPYFIVQTRILNTLKKVFNSLDDPTAPLVIVAQSLGGQVTSNYLWDASRDHTPEFGVWSKPQEFSSQAEEDFCRGKTLIRFYTTGCNIPIFVAGHTKIVPIPKPNDIFQWHNFYDADDVLGWPLKPLSLEYKELVRDRKINSGGVLSFTPLSHKYYWRDNDFVKPLVKDLKNLTK